MSSMDFIIRVDGKESVQTLEEMETKIKETIKAGQKMTSEFSGMTFGSEQMKKASSIFDVTNQNIKIQKEVIAELEKQYKDLESVIEAIAPGKAKLAVIGDAAEVAKEIEAEKKALTDLQEAVKSNQIEHESFYTKLQKVKNEMIKLSEAGKSNSEEYQVLQKKASDLQKNIDGVNMSTKALKNNTGINVFVESLTLASGTMATAQGIMALFANENENLQKIMVKLQATASIAIGLQQLQNNLQKEGRTIQSVMAVQTLARAKAEALATKNTLSATIAQ